MSAKTKALKVKGSSHELKLHKMTSPFTNKALFTGKGGVAKMHERQEALKNKTK